jgi:hypothetical protein
MLHTRFTLFYSNNRQVSNSINDCIYGYLNVDKNYNQIISFDELKKQGVTSTQLLAWMAPIDVAERYEKYSGSSHDVFYNSSSP